MSSSNQTDLNSIGIFDSGVGGITVLKELVPLLHGKKFMYLADTAYCPYGTLPQKVIINRAKKATEFLIAKGCNMIVVACNTATAAAIDTLRENYPIPFVGMEPAIKPAALGTSTKAIGVLATAGTFKGRLYRETTKKYAQGINVVYQVGEGLVELAEKGEFESEAAINLLRKYTKPMLQASADHIVLGCTHYPLFTNALKRILPSGTCIIDPAPAVARQAKRIADTYPAKSPTEKSISNVDFFSSGSTSTLSLMAKVLENIQVNGVTSVTI